MSDLIITISLLIISYLLGSIPFGYLLGKIKGVDIRKQGSGNIGSTNVLRILGLKVGLFAALCDILKGALIMIVAYLLNKYTSFTDQIIINGKHYFIAYGVAAVIGHDFSIFMKFRGGKGVAASLGAITACNPWFGLAALLGFIIIVLITRYVSLGSTIGALAAFITSLIIYIPKGDFITIGYIGFLALLIFYKHISNYKRLIKGNENKIYLIKKNG